MLMLPRRFRTGAAVLSLLASASGGSTTGQDAPAGPAEPPRVLVFSKTAGFRHDSIPDGIKAIQTLGSNHGFGVEQTEDAAFFTDLNLERFAAVIFLSTTGDVFDAGQQAAFEQYIQAGGGYVGIHAAADTEYDWPWYGELVGAWFDGHPALQESVFCVEHADHPATAHLPSRWKRTDEQYNFKRNPRQAIDDLVVLLTLDESSYTGGTMGMDHPIAWCREFDGGRAFYTGLGHTKESFAEPEFLRHMLGGIVWAAGIELKSDGTAPRATTGDEIIDRSIEHLLTMQEGVDQAEWPYEGVYRVGDPASKQLIIPIGYRIGGTAICATSLLRSPGFVEDSARVAAVERAVRFIVQAARDPLMSKDGIEATYDVRGWGYTYGLAFLLELNRGQLVPPALVEDVKATILEFIASIEATEIPRAGGWNYSRPGGFDAPGPMSPFMTAPTLQALFEARAQAYEVDDEVIERGLQALERARLASGAYVYAGTADRENERAEVPGAIARMAAAETTLYLAGRTSLASVRGAVDSFFTHWEWLDKRRAQQGTHIPPYGIAPYYFYYGHYYVAQAIEQLPAQDREEYRRKLRETLLSVRLEDGSWNDRIFPRSANFGTAMSVMALLMNEAPPPARWEVAVHAD